MWYQSSHLTLGKKINKCVTKNVQLLLKHIQIWLLKSVWYTALFSLLSDISYTLTLDADLQASRVTSRGLFTKNNERFLTEKAKISSAPVCRDYKVYIQVQNENHLLSLNVHLSVRSMYYLFFQNCQKVLVEYLLICAYVVSSTGGTGLCQLPESESRNRAAERRCEPRPRYVFSKCLGVLCKWLTHCRKSQRPCWHFRKGNRRGDRRL